MRAAAGKHLEVKDLWGQRVVKDGIAVNKIPRDRNSADALASPCKIEDLWKRLSRVNIRCPTMFFEAFPCFRASFAFFCMQRLWQLLQLHFQIDVGVFVIYTS